MGNHIGPKNAVTGHGFINMAWPAMPCYRPWTAHDSKPEVFPKEIDVSQARMQTPAIGQRATRPDGRMHGLGQTKYIDDIYCQYNYRGNHQAVMEVLLL